jgi:hypothetical protein
VLDGKPYDALLFLDAGPHIFETSATTYKLALFWSNTADRNYLPLKFEAKIDNRDAGP